jgi:hypothetical protein
MPMRCLPARMVAATVVCLGLLPVSSAEAESAPWLVVPACPGSLQIAVPIPKSVHIAPAASWQLVQGGGLAVAAQLVSDMAPDGTAAPTRRVVASIPPRPGAAGPLRFRLAGIDAPPESPFRWKDTSDKSLGLFEGDQPVLVYNHGTITNESVPKKDHRRSQGCYVHPVYGLSGEVITDDFPRDHYHHHGIFWTWPHVLIDGKEHDLWAGSTIRQKFVRWIARDSGPVAGVIAVENGWFVGPKKVMIERVWLRAYKAVGGAARAVDVELTFIPTDRPITLRGAEGKSYGGLTVRFAPGGRGDTVITVPSGRTKEDMPDTPLAWADFTSKFKGASAPSGAAVMVSPDAPDYPPTWLTRHYGPLCVGWPGVKAKTFEPGKPIRLSYRIWIHKDATELDELKRAYEAYQAAVTGVKWQ